MSNNNDVVRYAKAIKDIVYDITQEEILLDTEIVEDYEFAFDTESVISMEGDIIIYVPDDYYENDDNDNFILDYINKLYGLELEGEYDNYLFAILHEIGHIIDYSHRRRKWGKIGIGKLMLKRYDDKNYKAKCKLEDAYNKDMCRLILAEDSITSVAAVTSVSSVTSAMIELDRKMYYEYRQVTSEYEADKWAALLLKKYGAIIIDYLTTLGLYNNSVKNNF